MLLGYYLLIRLLIPVIYSALSIDDCLCQLKS